MDKPRRKPLSEQILQRIADTLARYQTFEPPPDEDSSVEVRKKSDSSGAFGFDTGGTGQWYDEQLELDRTRIGKYNDYAQMDEEDPEIASALDIYADNATKGESETDVVIHIKTDNPQVEVVIDELIQRTKLDSELWSITRKLVKDGDCFEEVVAHDDGEIHRLKHLESGDMVVNEDQWGRLDHEKPYEQKNDIGKTVATFKYWQIIHFKSNKERGAKYGVDGSVLFPIRKLYKQLSMLEDSLVLARLTRAIQRYAFLVDTEGIEPGQPTIDYMDTVANKMKKRRTIDQRTGKMDLDYNPMSMEEDLFVSTKKDSKANVKVLQGSTNLGVLSDVEYFRNKKFAGVKVPKAYLSHEKDVRARAMITEQDVQFARTVRRVQIALIAGLHKLFDIALATRGIDPTNIEYEIKLPLLSTIDELRLWQVKQLKMDVAKTLNKDMKISLHWILIHLLGYDQEDINAILAYLEDPDSLDNRLQDLAPEPELPDFDVSPDDEDGEDDEDDEDTEEDITPEQIRLLKRSFKGELDSLDDILKWTMDVRHNHKIDGSR